MLFVVFYPSNGYLRGYYVLDTVGTAVNQTLPVESLYSGAGTRQFE